MGKLKTNLGSPPDVDSGWWTEDQGATSKAFCPLHSIKSITRKGGQMKTLLTVFLSLLLGPAFAADVPAQPTASPAKSPVHRYLVERTFPAGALDGLNAEKKKKVNANNATVGVRWIESFANADKTKTFCVYEGPSEAAVRKAAALNALPVDSVTEVPVTLSPN
jgi:hypothetical protein